VLEKLVETKNSETVLLPAKRIAPCIARELEPANKTSERDQQIRERVTAGIYFRST